MPTKPEVKALKAGVTSYDMVNAIRSLYAEGKSVSGIDFENRIPLCTQATLQEIGEIFNNNSELANGFLKDLINRIGMVIMNQRRYSNNLKALKRGRLEYGETIEEIAFGLVKGKCDYSENIQDGVDDVFKITLPDVATALHKVNFQQKYPVSTTRFELKKAFTSAQSLGSFLESVITSVYNSYEVDEQLAYKNLIVECAKDGFFYLIPIAEPTDEATGKVFVKTIKQTANKMQFMNTNYNKYELPQFTSKDDLVILITADIDAAIEVDVLAAAFQASAVDFVGSGRKIMVDDFGVPGLLAVIADRRLFQIYDYDFEMDTIYNPSNRVWNNFLHVWEVISASPFMQGVAIVAKGSGSITSVTVAPETVAPAPGSTTQFTATVTGTGFYSDKVSWSITGQTQAGTSIDNKGLLTIDAGESADTEITVTATSLYDSSKKGTATATVAVNA